MNDKKLFWLVLSLTLIGIFVIGCTAAGQGADVEPPVEDNANVGLANPASVFCEEQGGTLEIRTDAEGNESGVCVFPDGSECEEWAFFRGECAPASAGTEKTIWVGPERVSCTGVAPQECYQIKETADGEWLLYYDEIEDFSWEAGQEYELRIRETQIANPPADGSSLRWTLLEIVTQTAVPQDDVEAGVDLDALTNTIWVLQTFGSESALPNVDATIEFTKDGGLSGSAGCNRFFGGYSFDGDALVIGPLGMTEMWCEGMMDQETAVLQLLGAATGMTVSADGLTIHTKDGDLVLAPAQHASLEDTPWTLQGMSAEDAFVSTRVDAEINAQFVDGAINGYAGCNDFFGSYKMDGETLSISNVGMTRRACDDEHSQREFEFITALELVTGYQIEMDSLTLLGENGERLIVFSISPAAE